MAAEIRTPVGDAPVIPVILIATGFYLAWFGIHYWESTTVTWPSDPVKAVLTGKPVPANTSKETASGIATTVESAPAVASLTPAGGPSTSSNFGLGTGTVPTGTAAANQQVGKLVAAAYGWAPTQSPGQWDALVKLWDQESGWDNTIANPTSGAYGIAQALGHGTADTAGTVTNEYGGYGVSDAMAQAANSGDPTSQITWGLQYIKITYGDPEAAWAHEQANNWY